MILNALRLSGCGTQHPHRALGGTRVLLAAAPTTPPCFRHWRRSSSLRSGHIQRKNYFNFAFVAACGPLQTHFHGWGRKGRWHICRLPRIPLRESWIQKRPQAFLNPKFKMKFLNLWPKRTRRPFQIIPQGLAHRGSSLTKQKSGHSGGQAECPVFVFFASAVVPNTAGAAPEAAEQTVLPLPVEKRKEWRNGAERLQTLLFSGATWLELANHRCENRIPQTVSLVNP
jgi:hypothetical protein